MTINQFFDKYNLNSKYSIESVVESLYATDNVQFRIDLKMLVVTILKKHFTTCNCPQKAVQAVKMLKKYNSQ